MALLRWFLGVLVIVLLVTQPVAVGQADTSHRVAHIGESRVTSQTPVGAVGSLLVRYREGVRPVTVSGRVRGSNLIPASLGVQLRVGKRVGFGIWRLDLNQEVSVRKAKRIAALLMTHPDVVVAEPDYTVTATGTRWRWSHSGTRLG